MVNDAQMEIINRLFSTTSQNERAILIEFLEYDVPEEERDIGRKFAANFDKVNIDRTLNIDKTNSVVSYVYEYEGHKFEFVITFTFVLDK